MKTWLTRVFKKHPLLYLGVGFAVLTTFVILAYPAFAQPATPPTNTNIGTYLIEGIFSIIAFTLMTIMGWLSALFVTIINLIILPGQNSLLFSSELQNAWQAMLNVANLVFFVALFAFSIMIITRSGGYNLKKAITSLVTTVIFANLSYRIVLVLVEVGDSLRNMASNLLGVDSTIWTQHTQELTAFNAGVLGNSAGNIFKYIAVATALIAMSAIIMFVLFRLVFILFERAVRLAILTIFAPLQISLGILPQKEIQSMAGSWFGEVVKWVLVMPLTFLIMAIGMKVMPTGSLETLQSFIITSYDDTAGAGTDQLTGTGALMFVILGIGIMFAATKAPDMLKLSLSGLTKTFTDTFADKWVLGGLQKQITGTIGHSSRLLGSWATESKLFNYKIGGRDMGVKAIRRRLAVNRLRLDEAKEQVARVNRDEGNMGFTGAYQRGQGTKLRNRVRELMATDPDYLRLQGEEADALANGDEALAKKKRQEMFGREKQLASDASKEIEKLGPGARKKHDLIFRQIAHQEATNTTRSNIDFKIAMQRWMKVLEENGGKLKDGDMKNFMEDVGGGWERANSVGTATERAEMAQYIKDLMNDPQYGSKKVVGMFQNMARDDWPGATLPDVLDAKIAAGRRIDVDSGAAGEEPEENAGGAADRRITAPKSRPTSKPQTPTEALSNIASSLADQERIGMAASSRGIKRPVLSGETGSQTLDPTLNEPIKRLASNRGFSDIVLKTIIDDSAREEFIRNLDAVKESGLVVNDEHIAKAKELSQRDDWGDRQKTENLGALAAAELGLGAGVQEGDAVAIVNALSKLQSAKDFQDVDAVARKANESPDGVNTILQTAYQATQSVVNEARSAASAVEHPQTDSIERTAADLSPDIATQVSEIGQRIVDALETTVATAAQQGKSETVNLSASSIDTIVKASGNNNIKSDLAELGKLIGRDQPLTQVGGQDQQAGKVYLAVSQLVNAINKRSGGNSSIPSPGI